VIRIGGFQPVSLVDFPGRVAAVVFLQGCSFRCPWCHNPSLVHPSLFEETTPEQVVLERLERRRGKIGGVVVTGGEPTLQKDLPIFLRRVRSLGFAVKIDTNGAQPDSLERILSEGLADFVAMDLKAPWERYDEACGVCVDREALERTLALLRSSGVPHHLRTTDWAPFDEHERAGIEVIAKGSHLVWQPCRPVDAPRSEAGHERPRPTRR